MKEKRNSPCLCGSGKKYKHCCGIEKKQRSFLHFKSNILILALGVLFLSVLIYGYVDYLQSDPAESGLEYCPDCGRYH